MNAVAAKAVAFGEALRPEFAEYARRVVSNARVLADALAAEGMRPVSGGTDSHLVLVDLRDLGVSGAVAEQRCQAAGITLNRNAIPYDPEPPTVTSGIRVGTPCVTTQGMGPEEMKEVASMTAQVIRDPDAVPETRRRVAELTRAHRIYPSEL